MSLTQDPEILAWAEEYEELQKEAVIKCLVCDKIIETEEEMCDECQKQTT